MKAEAIVKHDNILIFSIFRKSDHFSYQFTIANQDNLQLLNPNNPV